MLAAAEVAETRSERRRGLLHRSGMEGALVLPTCRWVHTIGMRFAIDVAYLDQHGTVLKVTRMVPHRIGVPVPKASWVIEGEAGAFERWGLTPGDVIELRTAEPAGDPADHTRPDDA